MGRECWTFVSAYELGCERREEEQDVFWNELARGVEGTMWLCWVPRMPEWVMER